MSANWHHSIRQVLPGFMLLVLMFFTSQLSLPFLSDTYVFLPLLAGVYYWSYVRVSVMPLWLIALLGLLNDVLYGLPLGLSLLTLLMVRLVTGRMQRVFALNHIWFSWFGFGMILLLSWVMMTVIYAWVDQTPLTTTALTMAKPLALTGLVFPLFYRLFNWCYDYLPPLSTRDTATL